MSNVWLEGGSNRQSWPIGAACAIGRGQTNDIILDDRQVSRRHALIHRQDLDQYWLVDLGSVNGSFVDGRRVTLSVRLRDGNTLGFGGQQLTFRHSSSRRTKVAAHATAATVIQVKTGLVWLMLADIAGSTRLAATMSPTDLAILVGKWMGACREIVNARHGIINKYLGDGFLAYWPVDTGTTVHMAEALQDFSALQRDAASPRFRVALHLGEVALGGAGAIGEESLTGLDVTYVFRMEKLAASLKAPLLVSEPAQAMLQSKFRLADAGLHEIPGHTATGPKRFYTGR